MYLTNQVKQGTNCTECIRPLLIYSKFNDVVCVLKRYRNGRMPLRPDKSFSKNLVCIDCMKKGNLKVSESQLNEFVNQVKGEMIPA